MTQDSTDTPRSYPLFLEGELIDLCIPTMEAIDVDGWVSWFNAVDDLGNTVHGLFPNHRENQIDILQKFQNRDAFGVLICQKKTRKALGVISLQGIDFRARSAEIAINFGERQVNPAQSSFMSLEAMAMVTEHGLKTMGLDRVYAGQAYPNLAGWNKMLELIAYRTEGLPRRSFRRGHCVVDTAMIACHHDDYIRLAGQRGSLWGSKKQISKAMMKQPKQPFADQLDQFMAEASDRHFAFLFEDGSGASLS